MRATRLLPVLAGLAIVLAACGGTSASDGASPEPSFRAVTADDLLDRQFASTSITQDGVEKPLASDQPISIAFADTGIAASAGCNTLVGEATMRGEELQVTKLASTRKACDPALMKQDDWLAEFLTDTPVVQMSGNVLVMSTETVAITLIPVNTGSPSPAASTDPALAAAQALCTELVSAKAGEADATATAKAQGMTARVVERDGEAFPATADYRPDRVNLTITGGVVTACTAG